MTKNDEGGEMPYIDSVMAAWHEVRKVQQVSDPHEWNDLEAQANHILCEFRAGYDSDYQLVLLSPNPWFLARRSTLSYLKTKALHILTDSCKDCFEEMLRQWPSEFGMHPDLMVLLKMEYQPDYFPASGAYGAALRDHVRSCPDTGCKLAAQALGYISDPSLKERTDSCPPETVLVTAARKGLEAIGKPEEPYYEHLRHGRCGYCESELLKLWKERRPTRKVLGEIPVGVGVMRAAEYRFFRLPK
jgi:hypothetical protein